MGFILFIIIAVIIMVVSANSAKKSQEKWARAASILGLGYFTSGLMGSGTISGKRKGHQVAVTTFTKGSGKNSQTYTRYSVCYQKSFPFKFSIGRQGFMHGLGEIFGKHDIEVGNATFDDQILVKGDENERIINFLTMDRQRLILNMIHSYQDVSFSNQEIEVAVKGRDVDSNIIVSRVRSLISFCENMKEMNDPIPHIEKVVAREPAFVPSAVVDEEFFDFIESAQILDEVVEEAVVEPVVAEVVMDEVADEPVVSESIVAEVVAEDLPPEATAEVSRESVLDLKETIERLLAHDTGSSMALTKVYEDQFDGQSVAGVGVLKRVNKFSYDPVFKNCKGVLASVEVCEISGAYSKVKVNALLKFPDDQYDVLRAKIGSPMDISGKMCALNGMLHQVYISDS